MRTILPALLLCLSTIACKNQARAPGAGSRQIVLPGGLELYSFSSENSHFEPFSKEYSFKVFTVINVSCATCILKFDKWKKLKAEWAQCGNVMLVPVCTAKDQFEQFKYLVENHRITDLGQPVLLDSSGAFVQKNKMFSTDMAGVSVLTDSDNHIILTGNPVETENDKRLFMEAVCKK